MAKERVEGLDRLSRALLQMAPSLAAKHLRAAVLAGAGVVRDEAVERAHHFSGPYAKGDISRNIIVKYIPEQSSNQQKTYFITVHGGKRKHEAAHRVAGFVGPGPAARDAEDPYYWWMVEFGIPQMAAQPFMRPAFQAKQQEALARIKARLEKGIDQVAKDSK